jgi:parallel beta helix pectate lyase-like protein
MNFLRCKLTILLFLFLSMLAHATSQKTYVSVNGNDGNTSVSCPATAPCRSFGSALGVTSPYGEVVAMDSGDYAPVTITQSVTLKAAPGVDATIFSSFGDGITITAGASDMVILRGLNLNGLYFSWGSGIRFTSGGALTVENCNITHFEDHGITVQGGGTIYINDTEVADTSIGIFLQSLSGLIRATIDRVHLEHNNYAGLYAGRNSQSTIRNSILADNSYYGITAGDFLGTAELNVEDCLVERSNYGTGIFASNGGDSGSGSATVRVSHSAIVDNSTGLSSYGASLLSYGNNRLAGNGIDGAFTGLISLQ